MRGRLGLAAIGVVLMIVPSAHGFYPGLRRQLDRVNSRLAGHLVDYTANHGCDRRLWSAALCQKRDLYVYLPPQFDPCQRYPAMIWMHAMHQDEKSFLEVVELFDHAMVTGRLPPFLIAVPDGSINGSPCLSNAGSFFINSKAGRFEDYVIQDVWGFLVAHYPVRPEPEAHILSGVSMGGFGAFNLGIKHRHCFRIVMAAFPPLNLRWVDCHGRYRANFDPCCWGWRVALRPHEVVGRLYGGLVPIRIKRLLDPLVGRGPDAIAIISRENPIEMLATYGVQPGDLAMYIGYGGKDEFNVDAQVESFVCCARRRGLEVAVDYEPKGEHDWRTGAKLFPSAAAWLAPQVAPYAPGGVGRPASERPTACRPSAEPSPPP
ncbi:MAG: esterase family protein [Gemmataceae bacterium]|nr:esterase family protein [Gemmataceae bacterium]MDW8263984.1 alpha/beta hydrolase-fold protein [Gemmataceae bacterium]